MGKLTESVLGTGARILIVDLETRPMLSYHWQPKVDYIPPSMNVDKGGVMCFAAKWYAEPKVRFHADWSDGHDEMINEAWRLLDEADIVIGYNSAGFDCKLFNRSFVELGLGPPSPWKDVDLLRAARSRFRFPYNSLNEVCRDLGLELKLDHEGFDLWLRTMDGDGRAQRKMARYNRQDVRITETLYDVLRPWVKNHPNLNMYRGITVSGCHACGSDALEDAGFKYTQTRVYPQFRCLTCGGYSQATHSVGAMHRKGAT